MVGERLLEFAMATFLTSLDGRGQSAISKGRVNFGVGKASKDAEGTKMAVFALPGLAPRKDPKTHSQRNAPAPN